MIVQSNQTAVDFLQDKGVIDLSEEGEIVAPTPYLIVSTKTDLPEAQENLELIKEFKPELDILEASTVGHGLDKLKIELFRVLEVIRIYGKPPGKPADRKKPFYIKKGKYCFRFCYYCS